MINYEKFENSLNRLQKQWENYQTLDESYPKIIRDGIAESAIQRFETCYDALWKALRKRLIEIVGTDKFSNGPKPAFRTAYENGLLRSPIEQWFRYNDTRNTTAHDDQDAEKTKACLDLIPDFLEDAIALYSEITGKEWRWKRLLT